MEEGPRLCLSSRVGRPQVKSKRNSFLWSPANSVKICAVGVHYLAGKNWISQIRDWDYFRMKIKMERAGLISEAGHGREQSGTRNRDSLKP